MCLKSSINLHLPYDLSLTDYRILRDKIRNDIIVYFVTEIRIIMKIYQQERHQTTKKKNVN